MHFAKIINSNLKFYIESIQETSNWIVQYTYNRHFQCQIKNKNEPNYKKDFEISLICIYDFQTIKTAKNCHVVCNRKIPGTDVFTINQ